MPQLRIIGSGHSTDGDFESQLRQALDGELVDRIVAAAVPPLDDSGRDAPLDDFLTGTPAKQWCLASAAANRDPIASTLWLLAGDLDRSHSISQRLHTPNGSYLHGVMHRREGDYGNAKYWFRGAGQHPVEIALQSEFPDWYPSADGFVDQCQKSVRSSQPENPDLTEVQWVEWCQLLWGMIATSKP
ncbi:hypothetical protein [Crateriforma conspicua]|uniref:Uncharacterized protein n=1 Tax=Crateriforma conspicua TaxID=2527996 RepID=A0A5C5Y4K6_9PLAN|nr:hypothetical protein [Crateriforma conspicua]TWT69908.1 hypothetical protein Pan14r_22050 [Crateriforma conspicua]